MTIESMRQTLDLIRDNDWAGLVEHEKRHGVHVMLEEVDTLHLCFVKQESAAEPNANGSSDLFQDDITAILQVLGISDHARPISAHEVVQREVLPEIMRLKRQGSFAQSYQLGRKDASQHEAFPNRMTREQAFDRAVELVGEKDHRLYVIADALLAVQSVCDSRLDLKQHEANRWANRARCNAMNTARTCADIAHFYEEGGKIERSIRTHFKLGGPMFEHESECLLDYLSRSNYKG